MNRHSTFSILVRKLSVSQSSLARHLGRSEVTISHWMNGKTPADPMAILILEALCHYRNELENVGLMVTRASKRKASPKTRTGL